MLEIHKQYVVDENGNAIAVQIPIEQFEQIEAILNQSEEDTDRDGSTDQAADSNQAEDPFEYKNGVLVLKRGSIDPKIVETALERDREERIRKLMSW